jgi:type II restriction enzyme
LRGNIGEWSEAYTFLRLLLDGEASEADSDFQPLGGAIKFVELMRDENAGRKALATRQLSYGMGDFSVMPSEIEEALREFERLVSTREKLGSFELPALSGVLQRLGIVQLKASSKTKIDLLAKLDTGLPGQDKIVGFSIKSELGSPSTLVNAGSHTAFKFELIGDVGMALRLGDEVPGSQVASLLKRMSENQIFLKPVGPKSSHLRENLEFFGTDVPNLVSSLLVGYYSGLGKSVWSLLHNLGFEGPHHDQAKYKVGQFLRAAALGMRPATTWTGFNEMHGGFLILRKTGKVLVLLASKEELFREYLLKHSYFDTPSTPRHKFGFVYLEDGVAYLDLNLQIRLGSKAN